MSAVRPGPSPAFAVADARDRFKMVLDRRTMTGQYVVLREHPGVFPVTHETIRENDHVDLQFPQALGDDFDFLFLRGR